MSREFTLRELDITDAQTAFQVQQVLAVAYLEETKLIDIEAHEFPPLLRTQDDFATSGNRFIGALIDESLVAVAELEYEGAAKRRICIASLGVLPDYSRRGIGRSLVSFVLKLPVPEFVVSTAAANIPAISLYQSMGFRESGRKSTLEGIGLVAFQFIRSKKKVPLAKVP